MNDNDFQKGFHLSDSSAIFLHNISSNLTTSKYLIHFDSEFGRIDINNISVTNSISFDELIYFNVRYAYLNDIKIDK